MGRCWSSLKQGFWRKSPCYFYQLSVHKSFFFLQTVFCFLFFLFSSPSVPFSCGLIRALLVFLWLSTWEKWCKAMRAYPNICLKRVPVWKFTWIIQESVSKLLIAPQFEIGKKKKRWRRRRKGWGEGRRGEKGKELLCLPLSSVDIKTEMPITLERWVHQGKFPGRDTKFVLLSTHLVSSIQMPGGSNKSHLPKGGKFQHTWRLNNPIRNLKYQ